MAESSLSSLTLRQEKRKYFKTLLPNRERSDDVISFKPDWNLAWGYIWGYFFVFIGFIVLSLITLTDSNTLLRCWTAEMYSLWLLLSICIVAYRRVRRFIHIGSHTLKDLPQFGLYSISKPWRPIKLSSFCLVLQVVVRPIFCSGIWWKNHRCSRDAQKYI